MTNNMTVNPPPGANPREIARMVVDEISRLLEARTIESFHREEAQVRSGWPAVLLRLLAAKLFLG